MFRSRRESHGHDPPEGPPGAGQGIHGARADAVAIIDVNDLDAPFHLDGLEQELDRQGRPVGVECQVLEERSAVARMPLCRSESRRKNMIEAMVAKAALAR